MSQSYREQLVQPVQPEIKSQDASIMQSALGQSALRGEVHKGETYLDEPLSAYVRGDVGKSPMGREGVVEKVHSYRLQQREEILSLPSDTDGLQLDRVDTYRQQMGGRDTALTFLSPDDFHQATEIGGKGHSHGNYGRYFNEADVATVVRDRSEGSLESLNGPEFTESLAIHELAHGSNEHRHTQIDVSVEKRMLRKPKTHIVVEEKRMGSIVRTEALEETYEGSYIEEAHAELERGLYVEEVLGRPHGFTDAGVSPDNPGPLDKYAFRAQGPNGVVNRLTSYAIEAVTLELIVRHRPELLDALRESKRSAEGLRSVAKIIDSVRPGTYQEMRKIDLQSDDPDVKKQRAAASRQLLVEVSKSLEAQNSDQ